MITLGITSLGHDASVTVLDGEEIIFAGHAERYSREKNDGLINTALLDDALNGVQPDEIAWYERPLLKRLRQASAGQWRPVFSTPSLKQHLDRMGLGEVPRTIIGHHYSHAAAGYYTSGFDRAAVIVCDAIGEFDTLSVWIASGDELRPVWRQRYPHSVGLLYSAFTQRLGFKPNEEEYIVMGMAAYGEPRYVGDIEDDFIDDTAFPYFRLKRNVHRGIRTWRPDLTCEADIAASIQAVIERYLCRFARWVRETTKERNLVYMGGVALNCVANTVIAQTSGFDRIWIMPNPGDAGSSLGAAAALNGRHLNWRGPYLGHSINRPLNIAGAIDVLCAGHVIGIAHGRAEFGPRALGNRSLLCDPRGPDVKDRVNVVKRREPFRPFAPIVDQHDAGAFFKMPVGSSPYMQFVAGVRRPDLYPAITHKDGSARVQTLTRSENPDLHDLLTAWTLATGCPMLLNTSMNVKGEPLVNTWSDAQRFSRINGIEIF